MSAVSVIILSFNEERHILRAIGSVRSFAEAVYVVDSHSTDRTRELAEQAGAIVVEHDFVTQARQFQWALDTLDIRSAWVMRLDADEYVEASLADEIRATLPTLPETVSGVNLKRKHIFMGRWVRHGGRYPLVLLRIWRKGRGRVEDRWMDEHLYVTGGNVITLNADFCDDNLRDLSYFIDKHNKYATREAMDVISRRLGLVPDVGIAAETSSRQAAAKRWIKERIYNRLPFPLAPLGYFFWRYLLRLGFLDGVTGLIYHLMQGFWYRALVGAKLIEFEAALAPLADRAAQIAELERLTGYRLLPAPAGSSTQS